MKVTQQEKGRVEIQTTILLEICAKDLATKSTVYIWYEMQPTWPKIETKATHCFIMSMESRVPVSKEQEIGHTFETGCTEGVYKQ